MTEAARIRLPAGLQEVAESAGIEAAAKLALARGGTRFYFPKEAPGSELAEIVGLEAATAIAAALGGNRLYIPLVKPLLARRMRQEGHSVAKIALALKCSEASVYNWTEPRQESNQLTLAV